MERGDVDAVSHLLFEMMASEPSYISHGELQMGIATKPGTLSPEAKIITAQELLAQVSESPECMLVAQVEGELAGFISARIETQFHTSYGIIADIAVDPAYQKKGIARALVMRVFESFQSRNVSRVFLESGLQNHGAHEFFARFGFSPVSKVFVADIAKKDVV